MKSKPICLDVSDELFRSNSLCNEGNPANLFTRTETSVTCPYCKYAMNRRLQRSIVVSHYPHVADTGQMKTIGKCSVDR